MNEDHPFLSAILANPNDRTVRLVYADWLEERGDPRGEFLRIQCQLEGLPADQEDYRALAARAEELRAQCPANWLAALGGPVWCVVANVLIERPSGPGAGVRRGTKHFAPGAKVHVINFYWGMGGERVRVVGRHRKSKQYITLDMSAAYLANWRAELVYTPAVIRRVLGSGEFSSLPRGGEQSQKRAEEIAASYNRGGAASQPYVTRPPSAEPGPAPDPAA
jgi:uncharacterized protein (TIGR02996 family)